MFKFGDKVKLLNPPFSQGVAVCVAGDTIGVFEDDQGKSPTVQPDSVMVRLNPTADCPHGHLDIYDVSVVAADEG